MCVGGDHIGMSAYANRSQRKVLDALGVGFKFPEVVSYLTRVLGTELWSIAGAVYTLNYRAMSPISWRSA